MESQEALIGMLEEKDDQKVKKPQRNRAIIKQRYGRRIVDE